MAPITRGCAILVAPQTTGQAAADLLIAQTLILEKSMVCPAGQSGTVQLSPISTKQWKFLMDIENGFQPSQ